MVSSRAKEKKRAPDEDFTDSREETPVASTSQVQLDTPSIKISKPKRAVTRPCPICNEQIPVRLLAAHAVLESARVQEILQKVGSTEVLEEAEPDDGFTARTRRSALKARKNMSSGSSKLKTMFGAESATSEAVEHTLRTLKRHRKQRHAKLRDMTREDEEDLTLLNRGDAEGTVCPVCLKMIPGDTDVVEAHVDSCLAHEGRLQEEREQQERRSNSDARDGWEEIEVDGEVRMRVTDGVTFRGTGFDIRNRNQQDVDDDIDVDGDDDVMYGAAQFTEGDLLVIDSARPGTQVEDASEVQLEEDGEVSVEMDVMEPEKSLRDLVADGKVIKKRESTDVDVEDVKKTMDEVMGVGEAEELDKSVQLARQSGNSSTLIAALENKVKLLCQPAVGIRAAESAG
ncbi:hypothetical protein EUX98_g4529 [Antrodiella citrinella]|uniref:E3 ubiquitin-protein ligase RNF220 middle domain-containing protein n=1 Tax=Antrodiella citrinella TaxID=2447956 RepID=A0A4S4MUP9_9APHY|nr:hypothetical protein EUX98_g4529 [Antrodiella citrinella]